MPEALQNALDSWSIFLGVGVGELRKNRKKIEISKLMPSLAGSAEKYVRVFGPGLANVLGQPIG